MRQMTLGGLAPARRGGEQHRLFFALWPGDDVRAAIAAAADALEHHHRGSGRRIKPQRYHLTLQFLGSWSALHETLVTSACRAAAGVSAPRFALRLDRAGGFRIRSMPWWLGCRATPPALQGLWDALGGALVRAGVRVQSGQTLTPHVTVVRDAAGVLPPTDVPPIVWQVRDFVLVHSALGAQSQYRLLDRWPLT